MKGNADELEIHSNQLEFFFNQLKKNIIFKMQFVNANYPATMSETNAKTSIKTISI